MPDNSAGRLSVDVEADLTGFARGLQAKVDAAVRNVAAKVGIEIEERGLRQRLEAALREASAGLSSGLTINIDADIDLSKASAKLKAFLAGDYRINIDVDVNLEGARANLDRFINEKRTINVDVDTGRGAGGLSALSGSLGSLSGAFGLLQGAALAVAVGALPAVAGAATALVGAIAPVGGALLALPGAFSAAAQGAAVLVTAFKGVGAAIKAGFAAQDSATDNAKQNAQQEQQIAQQRITAAEGVKAAQEGLADAYFQAGERTRSALKATQDAEQNLNDVRERAAENNRQAEERVESAERSLATAQRQATQAQQALNDAREQAVRDLQDMEQAVKRGSLDERAAILQVEEAQRRLDQIRQNPQTDQLVRREAQLSYEQAVQNLDDVRQRNQRNQQDLQEAQKKGVEGSNQVVAAQQRVQDANQSVQDAVKAVADAQREQQKTAIQGQKDIQKAQEQVSESIRNQGIVARENSRSIENAQRALTQAQRQLAQALAATVDAGNKQADAYQKALAKLPPSAQEFVKTLVGMRGEFKALSTQAANGLFPGLTQSLHNLSPVLKALGPVFFETGKAFGDFAEKFTAHIATPAWLTDIGTLGHQNAQILGTLLSALTPLADAFKDLAIATGPFQMFLAQGVKNWADYAARAAAAGRESGRTAAFMDQVRTTMQQLGRITQNVGSILFSVFKAAAPLGRELLTSFEGLTKATADWLKSADGQNRLAQFFDAIRPTVYELFRLVGDLGKAFISIGQNTNLAPLIRQIREELLPAVTKLFQTFLGGASGGFGQTIVHALSQIIGLITTLSQQNGALQIFVRIIGDIAQGLNFLAQHVPGMRLLITAIGGLLIISRVATAMTGAVRSFIIFRAGITSAIGVIRNFNTNSGALSGSLRYIQRGFSTVTTSIASGARALGSWIAQTARAAGTAIANGARAMGTAIANAGRAALGAARSLGTYAASAARSTGTAIANGARATATALANVGRAAVASARQLATYIATQARAGASAALTGLRNAGTAIANVGRQAATAAVNLGRLAVAQARAAGTAALNGLRAAASALANLSRQALAAAISMARLAAAKVASAMSSIATGVGRLIPVLRSLGATMITPPLGIVLAIAAVAIALVLLYKHSETFRNFVNAVARLIKTGLIAAFNGLKTAVKAVVDFIRDHWKLLVAVITGPIGIVVFLVTKYWNQIRDAFTIALHAIQAVWNAVWNAMKTVLDALWKVIVAIVTTEINVVKAVITAVVNALKVAWDVVWNAIKTTADVIWKAIALIITTEINAVKTVITTVVNAIRAVWDGFWGAIKSVAEAAMGFVRDKIGGILGTIRGAFDSAVGAIRSIWNGLSDIVAAPVRFIVNTVYNEGIRGVVNKVAGWVGVHNLLPEAHLASGGSGEAYFATGGGRTASGYSRQDVIPAMYRRGEHVLTPEETTAMGGHRAVAQARANATGKPASLGPGQGLVQPNKMAKPGTPTALASGPNAPQPKGPARWGFSLGGALADIGNLVIHPSRILEAAKDVAETGAAWVADHTVKPLIDQFHGFMAKYGSWGPLLGGTVDKLYTAFHDFLVKKDQEAVTSTPGAGGAVARWAPVVMSALRQLGLPTDPALVNGILSLISSESGGNPNAINLWDSNAAAGHPSQGLMQTIPTTFAAYAGKFAGRGITDPFANIYAGINYWMHQPGYGGLGGLRGGGRHSGGHYVGYSEGGGDPLAMAYGGTVRATQASNRRGHIRRVAEAGRDETILDTADLNEFARDLKANGGAGGSATVINLNGNVYNPSPETAGQTQVKRLRRAAALGLFNAPRRPAKAGG